MLYHTTVTYITQNQDCGEKATYAKKVNRKLHTKYKKIIKKKYQYQFFKIKPLATAGIITNLVEMCTNVPKTHPPETILLRSCVRKASKNTTFLQVNRTNLHVCFRLVVYRR